MIQISGTENYHVDRIPNPEKIDITSDLSYDADKASAAETGSSKSTERAEETATETAETD